MTDRGKSIFDGDTGIMGGIGNNITATVETIDCCAANLIDTSVLEVHFQGIAVSDLAILWFFMKNAALYGASVGNGRTKHAAGNCTMIYNGH